MRKRTELRALALEDVATGAETSPVIETAWERHDLANDEGKVYDEEVAKILDSQRRQAKRIITRTERNSEEFEDSGYRIQKGRFYAILIAVRNQQRKDGAPERDLMSEAQLRDYLFHFGPPDDPSQQDWLENVGADDAAAEILDYIAGQV